MLVNRLNFKNFANQVREWRNGEKEQDLYLYLLDRNSDLTRSDVNKFLKLAHDWLWDGGGMPMHDFIYEHWFDNKETK